MVHVMADAVPAIASRATIAAHVIRVFFIEISSLRLTVRKHTIEISFPRTIPSPPTLRLFTPVNFWKSSIWSMPTWTERDDRPRGMTCQAKKAKFMLPDHKHALNQLRPSYLALFR